MTSFILTEVADRERQANQQRALSLGTWVISLLLMGLALSPISRGNRPVKAALILSAAAMTATSKATADNLATHDRVLLDYRDISDNARQQAAYEAMKPAMAPMAPLPTLDAIAAPVEEPLPVYDLPRELSSRLKSSLILGAPRAGKGYAVAKAMEYVPEGVSIWLIDPKNDRNESHYWARIPASQRIRFDVTAMDSETVTEIVTDHFERFLSAPSTSDRPKLLVIDECSPGLRMGMDTKAYKQMMGRVATIASVGPSLGKFVWVISQATSVEDVGLSQANRASLRIVAVAHTEKTERSWLQTVKRCLAADMPDPRLTGFIQMKDSQWGYAAPFALSTPVNAPVPAMPKAMNRPSTATVLIEAPVSDKRPILSSEAKEALKCLSGRGKPATLRTLCGSSFAKRLGIQNKDAMAGVLDELLSVGLISLTDEGYMIE